MITRKEFESEDFPRIKNAPKQEICLKFLLDNKDKAFTTKEIAQEIYGETDEKTKMKAYFLLDRLDKKGLIIKKVPYWAVSNNCERILEKNKAEKNIYI